MRGLLLGGLAWLITACSVSLPGGGDPARIFVLSPKSSFEAVPGPVQWQMLVEAPVTSKGIGSSRIALRHSPLELDYYAKANWTDTAPRMVQALLIESFENSGGIVSVGRQSVGLRADYILQTELREFQAEYMNASGAADMPRVKVRLNAKLIRMPQRVIVASHTAEDVVIAGDKGLESVILAYDAALGKVMKDIVIWTLDAGEENWRAGK